MKNVLGSYYPYTENLHREFKEFCFKIDLSIVFSNKEILEILTTGKWYSKMSSLILQNINLYLVNYLPKYISCFCNANINGELYFGINDDGEITGIPSKIPLTSEIIMKMIIRNIPSYLDIPNSDLFLKQNISVNIVELDVDPILLDTTEVDNIIRQYKSKVRKKNEAYRKYKIAKHKWLKRLNRYRKLFTMINNKIIREEFVEWMVNKKIYSDKIKKELDSEIVEIPDYNTIIQKKKDKTCMLYWLMKYKDICVEVLCNKRPKKPKHIQISRLDRILSVVTNLNGYFVKNKNINFYLVIINIKGKNIDYDVSYRYPYIESWFTKTRIIVNNIPQCE